MIGVVVINEPLRRPSGVLRDWSLVDLVSEGLGLSPQSYDTDYSQCPG